LIAFLIISVATATLIITCPDKQEHLDALQKVADYAANKEADTGVTDAAYKIAI